MSPSPNIPGVYIEEVPRFPPSVQEVGTAIPAFVGYTEKAERNGESLINKPVRISGIDGFKKYYGGAKKPGSISVIVDETNNYSVLDVELNEGEIYFMYNSLRLFFDNGGEGCYIVSVGLYEDGVVESRDESNPEAGKGLRPGVQALEEVDEVTLIAIPDAVLLKNSGEFYSLLQMAVEQCGRLRDRFAILDLKENDFESVKGAADDFRSNIGTRDLKFAAAYTPWLYTNYPVEVQAEQFLDNIYQSDRRTKIASEIIFGAQDKAFGYDPIFVDIVKAIKKELGKTPPAGAVAGIYATVDRTRGVWKAPANISLNNIIAPCTNFTASELENLNFDAAGGKSINAIRAFTGRGALVFGARTLAGNDNEWRYISVRRFFNMVEESCKKSTQGLVFEPNDSTTWVRAQAMIKNYLTGVWRRGALQGSKPEHAFYMAVGLGETMTKIDIDNGLMIIEIGLAAVRPAEFTVIRFAHKMVKTLSEDQT